MSFTSNGDISTDRLSIQGSIIWFLAASYFLYEFLLRTVMGTFECTITHDLELSLLQFAVLSSTAYMLLYGVMQIPAGLIASQFGLKKSMLVGISACILSCLGFAFVHDYQSALAYRMLMGFGSAFGFVCLLLAIYEWLPARNKAFYIGISQFFGTMGPMLAAGPLATIINTHHATWRDFFAVFGLLGLILAISVFLFVQSRKTVGQAGPQKVTQAAVQKSVFETIFSVLKDRQVWCIGLYSGTIYFTVEYLSETAGRHYLMLNGYTEVSANYLITFAWVGYAIGAPLLGFLSDRVFTRRTVMQYAALIGLASVVLIIFKPYWHNMTIAAFVALGFSASGQSIGFALVADNCNKQNRPVGLSFNNAMITLMVGILPPIIGYLISHAASGLTSIEQYQHGFMVLIGLLATSLLISTFAIKSDTEEEFDYGALSLLDAKL